MFIDSSHQMAEIQKKARDGIATLFPVVDKERSLELVGLEVKPTDMSIFSQRKALVSSSSLTMPVYATLRLTERGRTLNESKIKILDLPLITNRGTFILQGKDYNVFNQMRLRPGVYTNKAEDSDIVASKFNLGRGLGFKVLLSDDASVFYVVFDASKGASSGQSKVPLYSLLKALGASDGEIKSRWGDALYQSNVDKSDVPSDMKKIVTNVVYEGNRTGNDQADILKHFNNTVLDKETTAISLGAGYDKVTAQTLLDSTAKIVAVYNNKENGDDMDSLLFKEIIAAEDHIFLRIAKGAREPGGIMTKMKRRLKTATKVSDVVPTNMLSTLVETFFTTSSLASPQTEINPIEILETNNKITAMGPGGIQSEHGIPMSARNLHPSHLGFLDPVRTTESTRVGVDLRMTSGVKIRDKNMFRTFLDKTGRKVDLKPTDIKGKVVGFAGERGKSKVNALVDGEMKQVSASQVDYWMDSAQHMFTYTTNLVPFLQNNSGNRITMAGRMVTQALPLTNREAPYVQVASDDTPGKTVHQEYAHKYFDAVAPEAGKVTEVHDDYIRINNTKVEIYNNFPMNYKTSLHMVPKVKVGDYVTKGQTIAESNYTKDGALALGVNARVAYVPFRGYSHEDAMAISETAAKKFTSQHLYVKEMDLRPDITVSKARFAMQFPTKVKPTHMAKVDDEGIVKEGTKVEKGDFLIMALGKREMTSSDQMLERIGKNISNPYKDISLIWDHDRPGVVTDVVRTSSKIKILLTSEDEARVGDKLTAMYGNKGTIGLILPDKEMPHDKDGKPFDIMLNPGSVVSRINPGQLYETMASKIGKKTGKPYVVKNFDNADMSKKVIGDLKKHGIEPEEAVYDPKSKKKIGDALTGYQYFLKLHKQTEGNFGARFTKGYDVNEQPSKGGEEGAKAVGLLDFYALLGHNARHNLREMTAYKGQKNEEFWDAVKLGLPVPKAKEPFAFNKFKAMLGATGINVKKEDNAYVVSPLTDKDTLARSSGSINNSLMMKGNMEVMTPEPGGIFDSKVTGGLAGKNWGHIELAEPIVHPLFNGVVKTLLGGKDIGDMHGNDVKKALSDIDVKKRIDEIRKDLTNARGAKRDKLTKELRYLVALKKVGIKPQDYVITKFPVLPPMYRPIYPSSDGSSPMVSDLNYLYRDLINVNSELKEIHNFPDKDKEQLRTALRQAAGAVVGTTEPVNVKSKKQELKGALKQLTGNTAKDGFFHRKIMYRTQDLTGRGTILPDPNLHVDEVKLPVDMMHQLFKPFVIKNLVSKGMTPVQAAKEVFDKSKAATQALEEERQHRPVIINRAPTLHKYNVLAFKPTPVEGKSIFIPPLVIKGFNADFDGDSVSGNTWVVVKDESGVALKQIKDV